MKTRSDRVVWGMSPMIEIMGWGLHCPVGTELETKSEGGTTSNLPLTWQLQKQ
jgi:hypothetical protein